MYCAVIPWLSLTLFGLVESSQLIEVLCTNTGIVILSILFISRSIRNARVEYEQLLEFNTGGAHRHNLEEMFRYYKLTNREIEIVLLVREGLTYREISNKLFIAGKTVENHMQNIYEKTSVKNKVALLHKLFSS